MSERSGPKPRPRRVFISYAQGPGSAADNRMVRELWVFLRSCGVDARLDLSAEHRRQDWSLWMADQVREADHILVIASSWYRERAEGRTGPDVGRGVQWEARLIRNAFYRDPHALDRFVPVVLPGQTLDGVPDFLAAASTTVYRVDQFSLAGAESLLRLLTDQPAYPEPPVGELPLLPPVEFAPDPVGKSPQFPLAVHRTVLVVDVEGFGEHRRANHHQVAVRDTMYETLRRAFRQAGISWDTCYHEDRGDGVFVLAPPETPKSVFVDVLPTALVEGLNAHNRRATPEEHIRLRMALHAGEVRYDSHGVTAASVILTFRLADAQPLKAALANSPGVLAVMVSSWFFDEVVRHSENGSPGTYRPFLVQAKETCAIGWVSLPDHPYPDNPVYLQQHLMNSAGQFAVLDGVPSDTAAALDPYTPGLRAGKADQEGIRVGQQDNPQLALRTLPRDVPAYTGRAAELAWLSDAVSEAARSGDAVAIHAVDGMAGVGKTAFAVHAGHLLADRFPDAQLFVRLHGHTPGQQPADPVNVLAALLATIGVPAQQVPADPDARVAMWRDRLAGRRVLLILDDAVSYAQVEPLLPASPGSLVMITSRRRLTALSGVVTLPLDILPLDEAASLFTRLSGRTGGATENEHVSQVVRLCGMLPLAVSLLAGRLRSRPRWSVADLAGELDSTHDRLGELRAEDIEVAAAFDLSYRELTAERQRFFRRLGLHPGPELDAHGAAALADVPVAEAGAHLEGLYNDHLLDEPAFDRYRMHDLIREYGRKLSQGDAAADREQAVDRLFGYYRATAAVAAYHIAQDVTTDGLRDPGADTRAHALTEHRVRLSSRMEAWAWMRTEAVNLIACAEFAIGNAWHDQVIGLAESLAKFLYIVGPWDQALRLHQAAAESAARNGYDLARADALNRLGNVQRRMGDYHAAVESHSAALAGYTALDDEAGQVAAWAQLGVVRRLVDDYPGAAAAYTRALEMARDLGERTSEAFALNELGIVNLVDGDYQAAVAAHSKALCLYEELGDQLGQADAWNELGIARRTMGDFDGAIEANTRAVQGYHRAGDGFHESFALNSLAVVWRMVGKHRKAIDAHEQALGISRTLGDRLGEAGGLNELGAAQHRIGDLAAAEQSQVKALEIYRELGNRLGEAEALNHIGVLLMATGRVDEAASHYEGALSLARAVTSPLEEARALDGRGRCAAQSAQLDAAARDLRTALTIFERIGASEAGDTREYLARLRSPGAAHDADHADRG
ncbi:tetratricopeptide repeat protein [Amycolatopsis sp. NPDC051045]|uniref:tetratricopeptide repeat protein n=1 Tax=Amycolatopsis sp. NPDC051045 TaxID=3156922 RepID=UPI00343CA5DF